MTPWKVAPNYKLVTPAVVSERPRNPSSLARAALQELLSKGLSTPLSKHRAQVIYSRNSKGGDAPAVGKDAGTQSTNCIWQNKTIWNQNKQTAQPVAENTTMFPLPTVQLRIFFFQVLGNIPCEHPEALGFLFLSGISRWHARVISIPHPTCWLASWTVFPTIYRDWGPEEVTS